MSPRLCVAHERLLLLCAREAGCNLHHARHRMNDRSQNLDFKSKATPV
jgi:hypothetical protein